MGNDRWNGAYHDCLSLGIGRSRSAILAGTQRNQRPGCGNLPRRS